MAETNNEDGAVRYEIINRILPLSVLGQECRMLAARSTADPKKRIYMLRFVDNKEEPFSLYNGEDVDGKGTINIWPYREEDYEDLLKEILDYYLEHAFETLEKAPGA